MYYSTAGLPLVTTTAARTQADQVAFIHRNSDALACFAYARCRDVGRGVIALFPELFYTAPDQLGLKDLLYFTRGQLHALIRPWEEDIRGPDRFFYQLDETVKTYDPFTSVVISFLSLDYSDDCIQTFLVDTVTPPPFAYAAYTN